MVRSSKSCQEKSTSWPFPLEIQLHVEKSPRFHHFQALYHECCSNFCMPPLRLRPTQGKKAAEKLTLSRRTLSWLRIMAFCLRNTPETLKNTGRVQLPRPHPGSRGSRELGSTWQRLSTKFFQKPLRKRRSDPCKHAIRSRNTMIYTSGTFNLLFFSGRNRNFCRTIAEIPGFGEKPGFPCF